MKNQKESIRRIISGLNNSEHGGGFWLPNIQRPFVWSETQIERLFDSIMREYPISTLLVWKTKEQIKHRKFIDNWHADIRLSDFFRPEDARPKMLVLDGQQRLQSLFIGLNGSYEKKELFFDVSSGDSAAPDDIRYRFKFLTGKPSWPWVKFKDIVYSKKKFHTDIGDEVISHSTAPMSAEQEKKVRRNIDRVWMTFINEETISYQELDGIDYPDAYSVDDVVEIFIRANSGGTKLGKSDLLFSLLTSSWDEADEQMTDLLDDLNRTGYGFTRDFVLKACLSMLGRGAKYDVEKFRDGSTKEGIINQWDALAAAIRDVKDFLYGKTFLRTDKAVPSYLGLIPVIYFRFHQPDEWKSVKGLDNYVLRIFMSGAFSGTPDNLIDRCTRAIAESKQFDVEQMFRIIRADGRSLEITPESILELRYGKPGIHLLFNIWYRDFNYVPAYENNLPQVDHIFPQSALKDVKVKDELSGPRGRMKYQVYDRDQVANCMLLTQEENGFQSKSGQLPEAWFKDKDEAYLERHLIPRDRDLWKLDNFEAFIAARKELILDKFTYLVQKGGSSDILSELFS